MQPAAGPQGQERARWREGVGGTLAGPRVLFFDTPRCTVLNWCSPASCAIPPGGAHPMARRSGCQARFYGQDARRAEEGGEHTPMHGFTLVWPNQRVCAPRRRWKRRSRPSSPMFGLCPRATCAKTHSAPKPGTPCKQTLSALQVRRCALRRLACATRRLTSFRSVSQGTTSTAAAAVPSVPRGAQGDVWDLMEPEDILTKLGKRDGEKAPFLQATSSEKWKGAYPPSTLLLFLFSQPARQQSDSLHSPIFASWPRRRASLLATMGRSHALSSEC